MPTSVTSDGKWITAAELARRLDVNYASLPNIVEANGIRLRVIPGLRGPQYSAEDAARVLEGAIRTGRPEIRRRPRRKAVVS